VESLGYSAKRDVKEFFGDIGVSDREVMICTMIIVKALSIQE
jgi:hypothetical protein